MHTQLLGLPTLPRDLHCTTSSTCKAHFLALPAHLVQWDCSGEEHGFFCCFLMLILKELSLKILPSQSGESLRFRSGSFQSKPRHPRGLQAAPPATSFITQTIYSPTSHYRFTAAFSGRKFICSGVKRQEKQLLPERAAPLSYVPSQFFFRISLEPEPWFCFIRAPGISLISSINIQFVIKKMPLIPRNKKGASNPQNWWSRAHFNCSSFTLRLSSAASNFFWISSRDTSFFLGGDRGNSATVSLERGLRISSKACPEARFSSSFTWMSGTQGKKARKTSILCSNWLR